MLWSWEKSQEKGAAALYYSVQAQGVSLGAAAAAEGAVRAARAMLG